MSIRTIIEINHDLLHQIRNDPHAFADALCSAVCDGSGRRKELLKLHGARFLAQRHHSTALEVKIGGRVYFEEPGEKI